MLLGNTQIKILQNGFMQINIHTYLVTCLVTYTIFIWNKLKLLNVKIASIPNLKKLFNLKSISYDWWKYFLIILHFSFRILPWTNGYKNRNTIIKCCIFYKWGHLLAAILVCSVNVEHLTADRESFMRIQNAHT